MTVSVKCTEAGLKLIKTTFALKTLFHADVLATLQINIENQLRVSKPVYAKMMNLLNVSSQISCNLIKRS
jgi:hypothetical protein